MSGLGSGFAFNPSAVSKPSTNIFRPRLNSYQASPPLNFACFLIGHRDDLRPQQPSLSPRQHNETGAPVQRVVFCITELWPSGICQCAAVYSEPGSVVVCKRSNFETVKVACNNGPSSPESVIVSRVYSSFEPMLDNSSVNASNSDRPTWSPFREVMNEASPLHVSILGCCHCESSVEASVVISQRPNKLSTASVCCNFSKSLLDQLDLSIECWSVFPADRRVSRY